MKYIVLKTKNTLGYCIATKCPPKCIHVCSMDCILYAIEKPDPESKK